MKTILSSLRLLAFASGVLLIAPGQVVAQDRSASAEAMLEEVIVTARRREESLQTLPLSVAAISADAMQAQGVYNLMDMADIIPNVALTEDVRANDTLLYIRGLGGGFSNPAQVFGTAVYIDGHIQVGNLGAFNSTVDVERIEVLRGPQGTLFGRNVTGGAVNIITAKPGPDFASELTMRAGAYGRADIRGMVNTPITDNLFARFNVGFESYDGYWHNRFLNQDTGGEETQNFGAALRWEPTDNWTIDTRVNLMYDRDNDRANSCYAYPDEDLIAALEADGQDTSGLGVGAGFADGAGAWGGGFNDVGRVEFLGRGTTIAAMESCQITRAQGDYVTSQDFDTKAHIDNEWITIDATYDTQDAIGPFENGNWQIKVARRYNEYAYLQDRDFTEFKIDGVGMSPFGARGQNRTSNEFETLFSADINDRLTMVTGFYYLDDVSKAGDRTCLSNWQNAYDPNGQNFGPDNLPNTGDEDPTQTGTINGLYDDDIECVLAGQDIFERLPGTGYDGINANNDYVTAESTAVYAHFNYAISEAWEFAVGARFTKDTRTLENVETVIALDPVTGLNTCSHSNPGDPPSTQMCAPRIIHNRDTVLDNGVYNNARAEYDDFTPTVSLTRHLAPGDTIDSGIVYATIAEGYLTGAFNDELNVRLVPEFAALKAFGPEYVTNYELGFKGSLMDGRIRVAADVFIMKYTDKQEEIALDNSSGTFGPDQNIELTQNVSDVDIKGIELELRAIPWDGGFFSLDLGWLDQEYSSFSYLTFDEDTNATVTVEASDSAILANTPKWTINAFIEHEFQLANGGTLRPQLGVYIQDDYDYGQEVVGQNSTQCLQDGYSKWRVRATYEPPEGNWEASLFGYNIADERIINLCGSGRSGVWEVGYAAPDIWGVEFTARFGGS
jgi:iron complex outermembrane receptor protein